MIRGIVFDLDDTLIDDYRGWKLALKQTCEYIIVQFGLECSVKEIYDSYKEVSDYIWSNYSEHLINLNNREEKREYVWEKTLKSLGAYQDIDQVKKIAASFSKFREDNVIIYDYAKEILEKINQMGIKIIICTDGEEELQKMKCSKVNIDHFIEKIISATDMGVSKPSEKVFNKCIEYFGVPSNEILFIGDSEEKDIKGARVVGMKAILVNGENGVSLQFIYNNLNEIIGKGTI